MGKKATKLKPKNLDLSKDCVETLTIEAVKKGTDFKNFTQNHLEKLAKKIDARNNAPKTALPTELNQY